MKTDENLKEESNKQNISQIKGKESPLKDIFSKNYDFYIPPFQRPYSWTIENIDQLFDDIYEAKETGEPYFLGSLVLIKDEDNNYSEVIDGQQRLISLTILISSLINRLIHLKDKENSNNGLEELISYINNVKKYIIEEGNEVEGLPSSPRLKIRSKDNEFFKTYIQDPKGIDKLIDDKGFLNISVRLTALLNEINKNKCESDKIKYTVAQENILLNTEAIVKKINDNLSQLDDIKEFLKFLFNNCYLIVVSTPNQESACRIFTVLNNRGMDLLYTDILKASILDKFKDSNDQATYTEIWEDCENNLGRDSFMDLFSQIRMIFAKKKPKTSLDKEFQEFVLNSIKSKSEDARSKTFIDEILKIYSDIYQDLKFSNLDNLYDDNDNKLDGRLYFLNKISNTDWMPPAMYFLYLVKNEKILDKNIQREDIYKRFFFRLERIAQFMELCSYDVNKRIEKYSNALNTMSEKNFIPITIEKINSLFQLDDNECKRFIELLNSDIYSDLNSKKRNSLLLRLDYFLSDNQAKYSVKSFTIEHVLPQTPEENSQWVKDFNEQQREYFTNKISNLVILSRRKNSSAKNYDFDEKKEKYFNCNNGGSSSFILTSQVLKENSWTPEVVAKRQKEILTILNEKWEILQDKEFNKFLENLDVQINNLK